LFAFWFARNAFHRAFHVFRIGGGHTSATMRCIVGCQQLKETSLTPAR
jgi:hypothetical protein